MLNEMLALLEAAPHAHQTNRLIFIDRDDVLNLVINRPSAVLVGSSALVLPLAISELALAALTHSHVPSPP